MLELQTVNTTNYGFQLECLKRVVLSLCQYENWQNALQLLEGEKQFHIVNSGMRHALLAYIYQNIDR